jgi:hypothetical protein
MLGAEDPLAHGQQRGELVPGGGRIPRRPGAKRQVSSYTRVLGRLQVLVERGDQRGDALTVEKHRELGHTDDVGDTNQTMSMIWPQTG